MSDVPSLYNFLLTTEVSSGEKMIAICRELVSAFSQDEIFDQGPLDTIIGIESESDHVILHGYGEFDIPSPRATLLGEMFAATSVGPSAREIVRPGDLRYAKEVTGIFAWYRDEFEEARRNLLALLRQRRS